MINFYKNCKIYIQMVHLCKRCYIGWNVIPFRDDTKKVSLVLIIDNLFIDILLQKSCFMFTFNMFTFNLNVYLIYFTTFTYLFMSTLYKCFYFCFIE